MCHIQFVAVLLGISFAIPGPQLLEQLQKTKPIGGDDHPNRLELEAQRALIQHAIDNRVNRRLSDDLEDRWGQLVNREDSSSCGSDSSCRPSFGPNFLTILDLTLSSSVAGRLVTLVESVDRYLADVIATHSDCAHVSDSLRLSSDQIRSFLAL